MQSHDAVYHVLSRIPNGQVATYKQVAELAGLSRGARLVGRLLHQLPHETNLPWHRVVNSQGRISLPTDSDAYQLQRRRLQQEGVILRNGRTDLKVYGWKPG